MALLTSHIALFAGRDRSILSGAKRLMSGEAEGLGLDFTDTTWLSSTGSYGSAYVLGTTTPANNYDSIPGDLLTYTGTTKLTRQSDGVYRYGPHNIYVNSATPSNQSITVVSGASYSVTITGSVAVTASGAATGTWTAGTNTFTAATATLTLGSTSGSGTVHVRRTPSDSTYLATGASAKYGLPYEWDTSGVIQGILVEPQATNLLLYSRPQAAWTIKTGYTFTENSISGVLGGTTSVTLLTRTAAQAYAGSSIVSKAASAIQYTRSVIVKKNVGDYLTSTLQGNGSVERSNARFNLGTGAVISTQVVGTFTGASAGVIDLGGGWYRLTHTVTTDAHTAVVAYLSIGSVLLNSVDIADTGYPGTVASVYVEHDQLEPNSVATSPIITYAASATRAADDILLATSAFPVSASTDHTMMVQARVLPGNASANAYFATLNDGSSNNRLTLFQPSGTTQLGQRVTSGGTSSVNASAGTLASLNKIAAGVGENSYASYINGAQVTTSASVTLPTTYTTLGLGRQESSAASQLNCHIQKIMVVPRRMSNAELQTVTT